MEMQIISIDDKAEIIASKSKEPSEEFVIMETEAYHNNPSENPHQNKGFCQKLTIFIKRNKCILILIGQAILSSILLYILPIKKYFSSYINSNIDELQSQSKNQPYLYDLMVILIHTAIVISFLPGKLIFSITVTFISKSLVRGTLTCQIGNGLGASVVFVIVRFCCYKRVYNNYKDSLKFKVLNDMIMENPWRNSPLAWSLFLPPTLKSYCISLTPLNYQQYIIGFQPSAWIYCLLFALIGYELNDFHELMSSQTGFNFHELTYMQISHLVITVVFIIFSAVLAIFNVISFRKRLAKVKAEMKNC